MGAADVTGQGNMWTSAQFAEWLQATGAPRAWPALQDRMKQIVMHTLVGAQDTIDKRARSFELFGCASPATSGAAVGRRELPVGAPTWNASIGWHCVRGVVRRGVVPQV